MDIRLIKLHYALAYAVMGALMPYLPVYCEHRGLSRAQTGWVVGVYGLAILIGPPLYTFLADRWLSNRTLVQMCYGLGAATLGGLLLAHSFPALLAMHLLYSLGFMALIPLLDGLTFHVTRSPIDGANPVVPYQSIRLWGSIGFIVPGVLFALAGLAAWDTGKVVVMAIGTTAAICVIGFFCAMGLSRERTSDVHQRHADAEGPVASPTILAWRAALQAPIRTLLGSLTLVFLSVAILYTFYPLYLMQLKVPSEYIGLITSVGVLVEIVVLIYSRAILRAIGLRGLLLLGIGGTVLRMVMLAAWPNVTVAIASQVFHGPMVVGVYVLPPMYLNHKVHPSFRNSMQGLFAMLAFGVARLIGSAIGGYVADITGRNTLEGLQATFWVAAAMALAATLWLAIGFHDRNACHALQDRPDAAPAI